MSKLDEILAELASIRGRLEEAVDANVRLDLQERREELHREARQVAPNSRAELEHQLDRLDKAWDRLQKQRIDVVKQAGDLAAGNFGFTADAVRLNQKIDVASGRQELEARIRELKAKLAAMEME
jgi:predicted  nucleic acid-binding Zn-ribbon protein